MSMRQWVRFHVSVLTILVLSIIITAIAPVFSVEVESTVRIYTRSIASGDLNRDTLSVREEDHQRVIPTPVPEVPLAIPLPPPPVAVVPVPPTPVSVVGSGVLNWPINSRKITTFFSQSHRAIDIEAQCGTAIVAATTGRVAYAGWKNNGGGLVIDIVGYNGFGLTYDHLSVIGVGTGVEVQAGQILGASGASGWSTGCHLHFGVSVNGVPVNPLLYL